MSHKSQLQPIKTALPSQSVVSMLDKLSPKLDDLLDNPDYPELLKAYGSMVAMFTRISLTPVERERLSWVGIVLYLRFRRRSAPLRLYILRRNPFVVGLKIGDLEAAVSRLAQYLANGFGTQAPSEFLSYFPRADIFDRSFY
jgi:hypothetical protein